MTPGPLAHTHFAIEVLAILAFALAGLIEGARRQLDVVGLFASAGLTAFGGGTLRDVLLDRRPFFWVEHATWLWVLLLLCAATGLFLRERHLSLTERAMQWPDAVGLGLFAAGGTQLALDLAMPPIVAVLMGVVTAVGGGMLRDIVLNEVPRALHDHRPYALCAFVGGWVLVAAQYLGATPEMALVLAAVSTFALRAAAVLTGWELPRWNPGDKA